MSSSSGIRTSNSPLKRLVVIRGSDEGTRFLFGSEIKLVGRAREADLVLSDRSISRHHFHIHATETGAFVQVINKASPIYHNGEETLSGEIKSGGTLIVGNSLLMITEPDASDKPARNTEDIGTTMVSALFEGAAVEVKAFTGIVALHEALETVADAPAAAFALESWAKVHAACDRVQIPEGEDDPGASGAVHETTSVHGGSRITVPARGAPAGRIVFHTKLPTDRITDSLRRLLVLAGTLTGSRLTHIARMQAARDELRTAKEDREILRQQAVGSAHAFLGSSPAAKRLAEMIPKLASNDAMVLLQGETGSGKTFVARLIHEAGPRKHRSFRTVNCAAIPENLIESELFGHERGAFSGATASRPGAFESVGRGTILLDEIGELPLVSQAKLLRVLDERQFERLGSNRSLPVKARILAATNRDLEAMVRAGTFRSDLLFRVSTVTAIVPALRERGTDIVLLAQAILSDFGQTRGRRVDAFTNAALEVIRRYPWPGNVRELRNAIEQAVILGNGRKIEVEDFPAAIRLVPGKGSIEPSQLVTVELPMNEEELHAKNRDAALTLAAGNKSRAAALLGIQRSTFYKRGS